MEVKLKEITVRELVEGYEDKDEEGVIGYGGKLNIRPQYQREFIYKPEQRDAVIDTVKKGFPLNVMYWADLGDDRFEIIDGQQRTVSLAQYVSENSFSVEELYFNNLPSDVKYKILDYQLTVYVCSGTDSEKLEWFKTINIAGEKLSPQELRNAVYQGPWVNDAKRYFSKTGCVAHQIAENYMKRTAIRQEYLETAIKWKSGGNIEEYMGQNQDKKSAQPLWSHFQAVINWIDATFPVVRKPMKVVDWGPLYDKFKDADLDSVKLEKQITNLLQDEDVEKQSGVYPYVLDGDERHLDIRVFSPKVKARVYERQNKQCAEKQCSDSGKEIPLSKMHADHIVPWSKGGKTEESNCQVLCASCNLQKSNK